MTQAPTATVLDAYAVVAWLADEGPAAEVESLLANPCLLTSVQLAEVIDRLGRLHGRPVDGVVLDLRSVDTLTVVPVDETVGVKAGALRLTHYHRTRRPISLADCVAAASAIGGNLPVATADDALAAVVWSEGGEVVALADSTGRRPEIHG